MFSLWWLYFLCPLALLVAFNLTIKWIVAPIRIRKKHRVKARPVWQPTEDDQLTPEMRDFMGRTIGRFIESGFQIVLNARLPDAVTNVVGYQLLFVNRSTSDYAVAVTAKTAGRRSMTIAITSQFDDGHRIVTACTPQIGAHPADPAKEVVNFRWCDDPAVLWQAHVRRLQKAGKESAARIAPSPGEELDFVQREHARETERVAACGYYRLDPIAGDYRLTWKGAYLFAWKLTQPIKRWRMTLRDRRGRRVWRSLGMGAIHPGEPSGARFPVADLPAASTPTDAADTALAYQPAIARGEVHRAASGNGVTLRFGSASVGQILAQKWFLLLWAVLSLAMLGWTLLQLWRMYQILPALRPLVYRHPGSLERAALIWIGLLVFDGWQIKRALSRARGTATVVADPSGVRFTNIVSRPHEGFVARADVQSFNIMIDLSIFGRSYRFEVRTHTSDRPLILSVGGNANAYKAASIDLSEAMGIEAPRSVPIPLPV
ncbi:MAG TPA: hypothetical protein VLJ39_01275 [Tepidisphaeraceae bacterium]|nr:hypothetical protein [Tepidisphaeraceae bacterium]